MPQSTSSALARRALMKLSSSASCAAQPKPWLRPVPFPAPDGFFEEDGVVPNFATEDERDGRPASERVDSQDDHRVDRKEAELGAVARGVTSPGRRARETCRPFVARPAAGDADPDRTDERNSIEEEVKLGQEDGPLPSTRGRTPSCPDRGDRRRRRTRAGTLRGSSPPWRHSHLLRRERASGLTPITAMRTSAEASAFTDEASNTQDESRTAGRAPTAPSWSGSRRTIER